MSAGIAFFVCPRLSVSPPILKEIIPGYLPSVELEYNQKRFVFVNVCAPSDSPDRGAFFNDSFHFLQHISSDTLLFLAGDFNCTLNATLDRNSAEPHLASSRPLSNIISRHDLNDTWRQQHPNLEQFSWCRVLLNHLSLARLVPALRNIKGLRARVFSFLGFCMKVS